MPVAKKSIQNIAQLIHESAGSERQTEEVAPTPDPKSMSTREMVARELEAFGKTDYTSQELDVIVEIYTEEIKGHGRGSDGCNFEAFSDDDLMLLVSNFDDLTAVEQRQLIAYFSEMEKKVPDRVARIQSSLGLSDGKISSKHALDENANASDEKNANAMIIDDDDDYNVTELIPQFNR
jgi:hypothetical protein